MISKNSIIQVLAQSKNSYQLSFIAEKLSSTEYTTEVRVASPVQEEVVHHLRRHLHHPEGNLYDQQRDTFSITDVTKYNYGKHFFWGSGNFLGQHFWGVKI